MKQYQLILNAIILVMAFTACGNSPKKVEKKPNLVYVFPDQMRKQAMNFWNDPEFKGAIRTEADPVKTPQLDKFAKESLVLTNAVSNCPLCSPHRGSLFTGLYPGSSGVPLNCNADRPVSSLREDAMCISDVLSSEGYNLAYFGKWHLDFPTPNDPVNPGNYVDPRRPAWDTYSPKEKRHGFDYWYSYGTWDVHKDPHYYDTDGRRFDPKEWSPKHEADMVISYLKNDHGQRDTDKPFALFVSMNPPHNPYNSLDDCLVEDYNLYKEIPINELLHRKNADTEMEKAQSAPFYFANVTGVDREFGRIVEQLKAMGEYDNTIVVFSADHGETMTSQGVKDAKNNIFTEAFEVPFLIRWPQMALARIDNLLLGTPDIMPTILGLMGFEDKIPTEVQGNNYSKAFNNEQGALRPSAALYIKNVNGNKNEDGLVTDYFPIARGIKTHQYTLELTINRDYQLKGTRLYNDDVDPYQLNNLSVDKNDPIVEHLLAELASELKRSNDPWYQNKVLADWINYKK
ncbi:sulfatase [Carboxylicivirga sp. M1479]|uniref:sulfatase family protein n=1 Tax=Carboxylicivirga sp. M1479 TaxID=2594476 RepID=UPI0011789C0F|nr:sulfatase [Carboxylicivirga sp. M1479]TRX71886.1 sulfatase [Carboxylicivirga sp. M1479]